MTLTGPQQLHRRKWARQGGARAVFRSRPAYSDGGTPLSGRATGRRGGIKAVIADKVVSHSDGALTRHISIWITDAPQLDLPSRR